MSPLLPNNDPSLSRRRAGKCANGDQSSIYAHRRALHILDQIRENVMELNMEYFCVNSK